MLLWTIINIIIIILWLVSIYYSYKLALEDYKSFYVSTYTLYKFYIIFSLFQLLYFFDSISFILFIFILIFIILDNYLKNWIPEIFKNIGAISDIIYIILLLNLIIHLTFLNFIHFIFIYILWIIFCVIFYYIYQVKIIKQWNKYIPFEDLDDKKIIELHSTSDKKIIKEIWQNFKFLNFKTIKEINKFKQKIKNKWQQITIPAFFILFPFTFIIIIYLLFI